MLRIFLSVALLVLVSAVPSAYAHELGEGYGWRPWMMWGYGMGWFWPVMIFAFWVSVIVGIILLIRWMIYSTSKERGARSEESALDILKKRYARGEIKKEEFEEKKKDIEG